MNTSGNVSLTDCQIDVYCKACKVQILQESVRCPKCFKCFHMSCVNTEVLAKNGGFSKCCGPGRKPSNTSGTYRFSLEDIQQALKSEITPLARRVDNVEIRLGNLDTFLKDFSTKGIEEHNAIVQLKQKVDSIVAGNSEAPLTSGAADIVLKELDDRLLRRSNLMIYGLPEDESRSAEDGNLNSKIYDCFSLLLAKPAAEAKCKFKCMRVGKVLVNGTNPRPVKIIFNSLDSADTILQEYIRLKTQKKLPPSLQHLVVARDQTPAQRQEYLALKEEMRRRTVAGEKDLRIVTKGTRQIIVQRNRTSAPNLNKKQ